MRREVENRSVLRCLPKVPIERPVWASRSTNVGCSRTKRSLAECAVAAWYSTCYLGRYNTCIIAELRSIYARSASAGNTWQKSLINTSRKSTTRFPMSQR